MVPDNWHHEDIEVKQMREKLSLLMSKSFKGLITVAMTIMVALVFVNAVLRYGFKTSIPESEELSRYFFVWISFLGMIAAYINNQHVGVDMFVKNIKGKGLIILKGIESFLTIATFLVVLWGGFQYFEVLKGTKGTATGFPMEFVAISIIFASIAFIILAIYKYIIIVSQVKRGD